MRTYPNILWLAINMIFISFLFTILIFMILAIIINENYWILFPFSIVALIITMFYYQLSNQFALIIINENEIKLYQPLKFKKTRLKLEDIKGYSISEFSYGRNLYSSKSFIIYPKYGKGIEIIKLFNHKFDEILSLLKTYSITKLGHEPYETGIYKRKYKFNN